jgi:hypothetical protein
VPAQVLIADSMHLAKDRREVIEIRGVEAVNQLFWFEQPVENRFRGFRADPGGVGVRRAATACETWDRHEAQDASSALEALNFAG